jgi:hypothetical protein
MTARKVASLNAVRQTMRVPALPDCATMPATAGADGVAGREESP